jgi:hypothetical protein
MTYKRPVLQARGPNRSPGGYYRAAAGKSGGPSFAGVPLQTTEDAVVAAVRAGYRIADAQIERGMRIAEELRGAARRAGSGDATDLLRNAEALAQRSALLGIDWLETLAALPSGPLRQLLTTQSRLLAGLIGLDPAQWKNLRRLLRNLGREQGTAAEPEQAPRVEPIAAAAPRIIFDTGVTARAVEIIKWQVVPDLEKKTLAPMRFVRSGDPSATFGGKLEFDPLDRVPLLRLHLSENTAEGRWKAPICSEANELFGIVIVEL